MDIIRKALQTKELIEKPPVLIDIGASGEVHKSWREISRYSICIAFDADERDFNYSETASKNYKKLYTFNCIVSDQNVSETDFFLTKSPHCSSLLRPDNESLKAWSYASFFEVEKIVRIKTAGLPSVLSELKIDQVDWFKVDSQGIDLRLFRSLPQPVIEKVLVAEFEPGLIDAYHGEDKLYRILEYMDQLKLFWLSDLAIKGSQRVSQASLDKIFDSTLSRKLFSFAGRQTPGWGEMVFINKFSQNDSKRDHLLGCIFSMLHRQHGFAFELAEQGKAKFGDDEIFDAILRYTRKQLRNEILSLKYVDLAYKKVLRKLGLD